MLGGFRPFLNFVVVEKKCFSETPFFRWSDDSRDDGEEIKVTDAVKADIWGKI